MDPSIEFEFTQVMHEFGNSIGRKYSIETCVTVRKLENGGAHVDVFSASNPTETLPFLIEGLQEMLEEEKNRENFGGTP